MSLTGDPATDALVPIAQQLIGAVRRDDPEAVEQALADAITATGGRCDPGAALAVVCAAMVPDDFEPSALLCWRREHAEYTRPIAHGVSPRAARGRGAIHALTGGDC